MILDYKRNEEDQYKDAAGVAAAFCDARAVRGGRFAALQTRRTGCDVMRCAARVGARTVRGGRCAEQVCGALHGMPCAALCGLHRNH